MATFGLSRTVPVFIGLLIGRITGGIVENRRISISVRNLSALKRLMNSAFFRAVSKGRKRAKKGERAKWRMAERANNGRGERRRRKNHATDACWLCSAGACRVPSCSTVGIYGTVAVERSTGVTGRGSLGVRVEHSRTKRRSVCKNPHPRCHKGTQPRDLFQ